MRSIQWLLALAATPCLGLPEGRQHVIGADDSSQDDVRPLFESPEHAAIGNGVILKYPGSSVSGADLGYVIEDRKLSFGDVVALAGDFFADWQLGACVPSISDNWDSAVDKSLAVAAKNVNLLRSNSGDKLGCVLDIINDQRKAIKKAVDQGKDVAQAYKETDSGFNARYTLCFPGYPVLALCNPDHFGKDAQKAYSSVHTLALTQAIKAGQTQKKEDLQEAYFIEAYSQHFLTDLFASGHLRAPRRILHSDNFDLDLMPGDQCCKAQHDEDGTNGLWVTNQEGQSWSVYGDKQYGQGRSTKNRQMVNAAVQTSVDEIWAAFQSGKSPNTFAALQKTPMLVASNITQSVPLFEQLDDDYFLFRQTIDQRGQDIERKKFKHKQGNGDWKLLLTEIQKSGSAINMFIYTKAFKSDQKIIQLSRLTQSIAVTNAYGLVDAGEYGQNWGMKSQGMTALKQTEFKRLWSDFTYLGDDVYSLVGRQTSKEALHIGLKINENKSGQLESRVMWNENIKDSNGELEAGEVRYGSFDESDSEKVMVKFFAGTKATSKVELWKLRGDAAPVKQSDVGSPVLNFLFSHRLSKDDKYSTLVGYAGGLLSTAQGSWFFCHWKNGYKDAIVTTIPEDAGRRPQAMLGDAQSGNILRISYGSRLPEAGTIKIEVFKPERKDDIVSVSKLETQRYTIDWPAFSEKDYQLWFMHDVDGDGINDLVTYTSASNSMLLNVVVFPGKADGTYAKPVTSPITLDADKGTLLTAEFMRPVYTAQSSYTYPNGDSTKGAIMSLFDNYGILGSRILAPVNKNGGFKYELKGQDGAIAGQRSYTIGERQAKWMGSDRNSEAIGFAFV